ncbi:hypothetical protein EI94DRAFT_1599801, partial [Lactarius quietus]
FGSSKPGRHDKEGHPIMTVIDRSSIHEIGVSWCRCPGAPERDLQVLEDFHLDNLECKTTPSQFFSHLRRLTNDEFPNTVPDRYRELLRVCQQWRALISRKKFGFGYNRNEEQKLGSMAVFCALCVQPGINLPENWREYKKRYVNVS